MFDPADPRNRLYERPPYFKVFVSSRMAEGSLAAERQAAIRTIDSFRPARAWAWERDAPAGSFYSKEECVGQAGTSDGLILIAESELSEITEAEYRAAHAGPTNVIVLLRHGVPRSPRLQTLIEEVRREGITKEFADLAALESEIDLALWQWFVRGGRTLALQLVERRTKSDDRSLLYQTELTETVGIKSLADAVQEARDLAEAGSAQQALEDLHAWAATATDAGHFPLARVLLEELHQIVPPQEIDQATRGWILNLEGRIASATGSGEAASCFEQMRQIGLAIADTNLIATAHQNLGVQAVIDGQPASAKQHFKESFSLKADIGELYGATQIALNMCNVLIEENRLDTAHELLDDLDPYLRGAWSRDLRATLHGQRAMVLTKQGQLVDAKREFQVSLREARLEESAARQIIPLQNLGANAMERSEPGEAKRWLRKALAIAEPLEDQARERILRSALGSALVATGEWEQAAAEFSTAADLAATLGDSAAEAEAWGNLAACWAQLGEPERALELIDKTLASPHPGQQPDWRAGQLRNLGEALEQLGHSEEALARLEEAARLADSAELKDGALQRGAEIALAHPGLANRAIALLDQALALQRTTGENADWAWRAATVGALLSNTSQVGEAPRFFSLALRVFARNGDRRRAFYIRNDRSIAHGRCGDLSRAVGDMRVALAIASDLADRRLIFQAEMNLGELERRRGRYTASEQHQRRALATAKDTSDESNHAAALNMLGLLRIDQGRIEEAEKTYREALDVGRRLGDADVQHGALGGLAGIAYRRRRFAEAERRYQQAIHHHGAAESVNLAEDLGGLALSRAARGHVVESEIQRLVDLSGIVGWDEECAEVLAHCARMLIDSGGELDEAIGLQAGAIICSLRGLLRGEAANPEDAPPETLIGVLMLGLLWMRERDDYSRLKVHLLGVVSDGLRVDDGEVAFIDELIAMAECALQD